MMRILLYHPQSAVAKPGIQNSIMYIALLRFTALKTGLNGYYPTVSDILLNNSKRWLMQLVAGMRYKK
jgi:hypothetical protein